MGKADFLFVFLFGVLITLFVINLVGPLNSIFDNSVTAAAIYEPDNISGDVVDVLEESINYSLIETAFQSNDISTYAAECKPHAYIIGDNVTKHLCSLYFQDKVEVRKISSTGSMWPNLMSGGYIIVKDVYKISELSAGDIIIVSDTVGKDVAHRITRISYDDIGPYVVTQGDNNYFEDSMKFRIDDIESKVVGVLY